MPRRTTIEIDEELLARAKRALGGTTTRWTVEEALRIAADVAEHERGELAARQGHYLASLLTRGDPDVLASEQMWR
jgi:Arc/MetJ family transcription regulator